METIAAPESTSRLIERPRLLAELDAAEARGVRAICLVAPAGYGKTVLAEQWVRSRHPDAIWHYATDGSADGAYLAACLASSLEFAAPGISKRVQSSLVTAAGNASSPEVARQLIRPLCALGREPWIVIDDFQFCEGTSGAALLVEMLRGRAIRLVLTSRVRPQVASPRALIYAEASMLDLNDLRFTEEETATLTPGTTTEAAELVAATGGWPVLVALAAKGTLGKQTSTAENLFEFFAQDVYGQLSTGARIALCCLSLSPRPDVRTAVALSGPDATEMIAEAVSRGLLSLEVDGVYRIHPLFREFLVRQFARLDSNTKKEAARRAFAIGLRSRDWHGAFAVAERSGDSHLVARLLRTAYRDALAHGLHASVERWLAGVPARNPLHSLVRAELDVSASELARAE